MEKCLESLEEKQGKEREDLTEEVREFHRRMVEGKKDLEKELERQEIGRKLLESKERIGYGGRGYFNRKEDQGKGEGLWEILKRVFRLCILRREDRVEMLNEEIMEEMLSGWNLEASFRAKSWTDSSLEERVEEEGDQTGEQYSRIGRTNEIYRWGRRKAIKMSKN